MARRLQVPKSQEEALAALVNLSAEDAASLESALSGASHALSIRALSDEVAKASGLSNDFAYRSLRLLSMLYSMMDRADDTSAAFLLDLERAAKATTRDELKSPNRSWDDARQLIGKLLSFPSLSITAKSIDLISENDQVFCDVRVVSDLRPLFLDDVEHEADAFILLHKLRITYHQGNRLEATDITLDARDVESVIAALKRAEDKGKKLQGLSSKIETPILRTHSHED